MRKEIVVAHYREPLDWPARLPDWPVRVYHKSDHPAGDDLPNVGREAHTYLWHIVERYDRLAETTVFLQGDPADHVRDLPGELARLSGGSRFRELGSTPVVEDAGGLPSHPGLDVRGAFRALLGRDPPGFLTFRAGACFAVSRDAIRSRPREFYRRALEWSVSSPQGPWELERMWPVLFGGERGPRGVVTASDAGMFEDVAWLLRSLRAVDPVAVEVFDLGLTEEQRGQIEAEFCGVRLCAIPPLVNRSHRLRKLPMWQTWLKPFYLLASDFDRPLWIDADCFVLSPLEKAFAAIESAPLLVADQTDAVVVNREELLRYLPLNRLRGRPMTVANAGVVGLDRFRDRELLAAWAWTVQFAGRNLRLAHLFCWYDQGALLWALERLGLRHLVRQEPDWNQALTHEAGLDLDDTAGTPVEDGEAAEFWRVRLPVICKELRQCFPTAKIVHFLGPEKLSRRLRGAQFAAEFRQKPLDGISTTNYDTRPICGE